MAAKIKKGDLVEIMTGRDKKSRGRVLEIDNDRVRVDGVFVQKRHVKPNSRQSMPQGGIVDQPGWVHISNVRLFSERLGKGVRVGFVVDDKGNKQRVVRGAGSASGSVID